MSKTCRGCDRVLPLDAFYAHPRMADGRLNHCKECRKEDARRRRADGGRREYERVRNQRPERRAYRKQLQERRRREHPEKIAAWNAVSNGLRAGRLAKAPCLVCGSVESEAHHHAGYDAEHALDVVWLCRMHHRDADLGRIPF